MVVFNPAGTNKPEKEKEKKDQNWGGERKWVLGSFSQSFLPFWFFFWFLFLFFFGVWVCLPFSGGRVVREAVLEVALLVLARAVGLEAGGVGPVVHTAARMLEKVFFLSASQRDFFSFFILCFSFFFFRDKQKVCVSLTCS
jgi:hypothetical protein